MSLPATDNFNRADGDEGANWTPQINSFVVSSNEAQGSAGSAMNASFWNADSFPDDQYSQAIVATVDSGGPTVRASGAGGAENYYWYEGKTSSNSVLSKWVGGAQTNLQTGLPTVVVASVMRIAAVGTTIQIFDDGVQVGIDQTDASLSSGSAGKSAFAAATELDDWEGGSLATAEEVSGRLGRPAYSYSRVARRRVLVPGA